MTPDFTPLAIGLIVLLASLISLKVGLSVAIIEILLGTLAGNIGVRAEDWMLYLASFAVSVVVIVLATKFSHLIVDNPGLKNKVIEPEIKYVFLLLLVFTYFANLGEGHAVLPAFLLGLLMSKHFRETSETKEVRNRLRTVAYAVITPIFFIVGGLKISLPMILSALGLFAILLVIKVAAKFIGVYFLARKYIPNGSTYVTLLMSTGLTFGTIASVFGLTSGLIDQVQYSLLIGVVVASAVIPTFIAQKWFKPVHSEDLVDIDNGRTDSIVAT